MKLPAQLKSIQPKYFALGLVAIILTIGATMVAVHRVQAQGAEAITLTAIPPRLGENGQLKARPGEKVQASIRVSNPTSQPIKILSTATDFVLDSDGATPIPVSGQSSSRWSLASWMAITPAEQIIGPNKTVGVNVLIEVPKDALPGGHYAMITHQPQIGLGDVVQAEANSEERGSAGVTQKVGTLIYFIVDGPINEEAFIRNVRMPDLIEYGPVPYNFSIENMSDIHIAPQITIEYTNWLGQKVDKIQVPSKNVFPLSSREFEGKWNKIWGFGRYKAEITAGYGQSGKIAIATTHFWLMPITLIVAILVTLLTLVAIIISVRRHLIYRKTNQSSKISELEQKIRDLETRQSQDLDEPIE